MPHFHNLPIMPKESKTPISMHGSLTTPYPTPTTAGPRLAGIWCAVDDDKLLQARASGLNWQPIASQYFPNKSANACRKRHERLIERRQASDWDAEKLDRLAQEYVAMRKEMWEPLAAKLGERWNVVEAKVSIFESHHRQQHLTKCSAWKKVSRLYSRWLALLKEGTRVHPVSRLTIKVSRITTATPLLAWVRMLRWS